MKKRFVSLLAGGVLAASALAGFTACGGGDKVQLTVWGTAAQQDTLTAMVEEFKQANPDTKYDIKVGISEEDMAYSNVGKDPSAAADVYCYSNDQLIPLLRVGALARLGGSNLETVKANNSEDSVKSGSISYGTADEKVYGYPYASDNGYFMIYDKSVVTDTSTLEGIIKDCEDAGRTIGWAIDVPWYTAGWFFAFGCSYSVDCDYNNNYLESNIRIDFNSEAGVKASKAIKKLTSSKAFAGKGTDNNTIITGFQKETNKMAVAVTGTWNAKRLKEILGSNYGVCELPTVTVDSETKHLSSFKGYKLMGVNPHSKNLGEAHKLAAFLTSEAMQKERFEKHLVGPTNINAANNDAIKTDETFIVLNKQNEHAVEQTSVPTGFWEPLKNYGLNIIDGIAVESNPNEAAGEGTYKQKLDQMVALIKGVIS